jgi:hypothetical protein
LVKEAFGYTHELLGDVAASGRGVGLKRVGIEKDLARFELHFVVG